MSQNDLGGWESMMRGAAFMIAVCWGIWDGAKGPAKPDPAAHRAAMAALSPEAIDVVEQRGRIVFRWHGDVSESLRDKLDQAFAKYAGDKRGFVLSLNSRGGSVKTGFEVIERVKREQKTRNVDTLVEGTSYCGSMCVGIYLAGTNRNAHRDAQFMFHRARVDVASYEEHAAKEATKTGQRKTAQAMKSERDTAVNLVNVLLLAWYLEAGADKTWVETLRRRIEGGSDWTLSGRELVDQHAGIIDRLM